MRPLPAVLLDLHEEFATGKLVLKRGRVSKTVDLVNGNPVSTASTQRDETLGHFLVNCGVITEEQHREAVQRAATLGGKLGEALVAQQALTMEQLFVELGKQARHKLVQALRWPQGAWRFDDGEPIEGMQLRMVEVVLTGLRETAIEDLARLQRLDGMSFELTERGTRLRHEIRKVFGDPLAARLAAGAPIVDLELVIGDRAQARLAVDALILCGAVQARVAQVGLGAAAPRHRPVTASAPSLPRAPTRPQAPGSALFDLLFDDLPDAPVGVDGDEGAAPLEFADQDSGVVSVDELSTASSDREHATAARQSLLAEHQRIQGADHYAVLMTARRATAQEIDAAVTIRMALLDQSEAQMSEARDRARVEEVRQAYTAARAVLLDERKRAAYDRELAGGELVQVAPAIDTELNFRMAEELMAKGQWGHAIGNLKLVIARSPGEADYHAALGWAEWKHGGERLEAADVARQHLNAALEINPDHAAAHEYKGRIDAGLQADETEALFHLERAIDLDPNRIEAVVAIEALLSARGELRRYERVLKRLLFRLRGRANAAEAKAWVRLAMLYLDHLDDPAAASAAAVNAQRIAPRDTDVAALVKRTEAQAAAAEPVRAGWREALDDPHSGAALVHSTEASGHADAAFLAAATMVALGTAPPEMAAVYERGRKRDGTTTAPTLTPEQWALLRHKDDGVELGALFELVAPAVHAVAPMTLADGDLDASQRIEDADLPPSFAKLRVRCAEVIGVEPPPVYARVELGSQIHVIAADPPVLVAGDEALTAPDRPELVFRLVRAMTFLWPGRTVGASRPGRVLRAVVMAVFREASGSTVGGDEPLAPAAEAAVAQLPMDARVQARAAALRLLSRGGGLNLSMWARSLSRTADRAGMLISGDVPAAFAGAKEVGELERDLVEFAYSAAHVQLRKQLGLARA